MRRDPEEKVRQLAPLDPALAEQAWLFYLAGEGAERGHADDLLDVLLFQAAQRDYRLRIRLDPPPPESCAGAYPCGMVLYPPGQPYCSFGLREDEWVKHVLIVGMTGTGKTTLAYTLLRQLWQHRKPFLVCDWKGSYRRLRRLPEFRAVAVFTVARAERPFRFNPLVPPGTRPGEWLMHLVDVLKHAYFVGEGVEYQCARSLALTLLFKPFPLGQAIPRRCCTMQVNQYEKLLSETPDDGSFDETGIGDSHQLRRK